MIVKNSTSNTLVSGSSSADSVYNSGYYVTINANSGNDTIYNDYVNYVSVNAGEGNDSINNYSAWYSTVDAGDGNDTIVVPYRAWQDSINGGAGNDLISLSRNTNSYNGKNTIVGGTGNDTIYANSSATRGNLFKYTSGDGDDIIYNWNSRDTLQIGSAGTYSTTKSGSDLIVTVDDGNITLKGAASLSRVNINPIFTGGVTLSNSTRYTLLTGTSYADSIKNSGWNVTINTGASNDTIYNDYVNYVSVNAGEGNDSINNYSAWYSTVDAGDGNDTIVVPYRAWQDSINGGAGNDIISLSSNTNRYNGKNTIVGGTGNDTIYGNSSAIRGNLFKYTSGDGYDSILNWNSNDTLSLGGLYYSTQKSGSNYLVSISGGGAITLGGAGSKNVKITGGTLLTSSRLIYNYTSNTVVTGSDYSDTIYNYASVVTINANSGADSVYNSAYYVTINTGDGADTIQNYSGDYVSINGGAGDDTIIAGGNEHSVFGNAGADIISLSGDKLTVNGGKGDDTIYGSTATSHLYEYKKGDGNDVIYNWSSNDTLTLTGGESWSSVESGSNVIITVQDSGNITLGGANGKTVNVYPTTNPTITPEPTPTVTQQDVIKNFMKSLDTTNNSGIAALNQAVSVATGGYFSNISAAVEQMTLDCAAAGSATNFLETYCGIDLSNDDTGAISGYDAGGSSTQKGAADIVPESGTVNNYTSNSFTTKGLTVQLARFDSNYNPYAISYTSLTSNTQRYIWQAFQTWWVDGALDLIEQSYGSNYGFSSSSSAPVKTLYFGFENENSGVMATTYYWTYPSTGKNAQLAMTVNMHNYNSLIIGNSDGKISGYNGFYLDRVLAHEFTHAVMAANMNYFGNLPMFISEGMAELTHGTDDDRRSEITALASNSSNLKSALNLYSGSYSAYAGGYMFLRYLAKQGSEHYPTSASAGYASSRKAVSDSPDNSSAASVKGGLLTVSKDFIDDMIDLTSYSSSVKKVDATALTRDIMIVGNQSANSISAGTGDDTISANTGNDTVRGGAGDDIILGDAGNDKLYGNAGNDSLNGGSGNDTLWGGAGNDVFVHKADNDYIYDYVVGEDKIKLAEEYASITAASISGSDVVFTVGTGSITVKDGKNKEITVVDYNGNATSSVYGGATLTLTNTSATAVTLGTNYQNANATARTKAIKIKGNAIDNVISGGTKNDSLYGAAGNDSLVGNAGADKLYGGSGADTLVGGAGNDSLWGGAGNDSLWGGAGKDNFVYKPGEGTDKIFDYASGDILTILKKDGKAGGTFTKSSFINGTLTLTISGGGSVVFSDVASSDKFNINGKTYKISGSKLK